MGRGVGVKSIIQKGFVGISMTWVKRERLFFLTAQAIVTN
jgi:hypothetical protein